MTERSIEALAAAVRTFWERRAATMYKDPAELVAIDLAAMRAAIAEADRVDGTSGRLPYSVATVAQLAVLLYGVDRVVEAMFSGYQSEEPSQKIELALRFLDAAAAGVEHHRAAATSVHHMTEESSHV